jgi:hypothetical protein
MNLIADLDLPAKEKAYYFLLSTTEVGDDEFNVYSKYSKHKIIRMFGSDVLKELEEDGKIVLRNEGVQVAWLEATGKYTLMNIAPAINWIAKLEPYGVITRSQNYTHLLAHAEDIYSNNQYANVTVCGEFYKAVYELVLQLKHRPFLAKEYGQLRSLLSLYSAKDFMDMVIEFFTNGTAYYKQPSLGLLMYHKDTLFGVVKAASKRKTQKITKEDEGF